MCIHSAFKSHNILSSSLCLDWTCALHIVLHLSKQCLQDHIERGKRKFDKSMQPCNTSNWFDRICTTSHWQWICLLESKHVYSNLHLILISPVLTAGAWFIYKKMQHQSMCNALYSLLAGFHKTMDTMTGPRLLSMWATWRWKNGNSRT